MITLVIIVFYLNNGMKGMETEKINMEDQENTITDAAEKEKQFDDEKKQLEDKNQKLVEADTWFKNLNDIDKHNMAQMVHDLTFCTLTKNDIKTEMYNKYQINDDQVEKLYDFINSRGEKINAQKSELASGFDNYVFDENLKDAKVEIRKINAHHIDNKQTFQDFGNLSSEKNQELQKNEQSEHETNTYEEQNQLPWKLDVELTDTLLSVKNVSVKNGQCFAKINNKSYVATFDTTLISDKEYLHTVIMQPKKNENNYELSIQMDDDVEKNQKTKIETKPVYTYDDSLFEVVAQQINKNLNISDWYGIKLEHQLLQYYKQNFLTVKLISTEIDLVITLLSEVLEIPISLNNNKYENEDSINLMQIEDRYERYSDKITVPLQLNPNEHVMIKLENPIDDFIKSLLIFAHITDEDGHLDEFWTSTHIKNDIEEHIERKMEEPISERKEALIKASEMQKEKTLWTLEGMKTVIQIIPDVFEVDVVVYDIERKYKTKYNSLSKTLKSPILIIKNGENLNPVRNINHLRREFVNLFIDSDKQIIFNPLSFTDDDADIDLDYHELSTAIKNYNSDKDHREKNRDRRNQLKEMKDNYDNPSQICEQACYRKVIEDFQSAPEYKTSNVLQRYLNCCKAFAPSNKRDRTCCNSPDDPNKLQSLSHSEIYALYEIFQIYIGEDWKKLNENTFSLIKENFRIYTGKLRKRIVLAKAKEEDEKLMKQITEFYYSKYHKVKITQKDVVNEVEMHQSFIYYSLAGTLLFDVIPYCCAWKTEYLSENGSIPTYEIKIANKPMGLFLLWSLQIFLIMEFKNPFLMKPISNISEMNDLNKMKTLYPKSKCSLWVDKYLKCKRTVDYFIIKPFEKLEEMMEGKHPLLLLTTLFIVDQIGNLLLNWMRDSNPDLQNVIPPDMGIKYCIHKPLITAKVFVLVFFGKTEGFHMKNVFDILKGEYDTSGEFADLVEIYLTLYIPVLLLTIPTVVTAKLIKITVIATGREIAKYRRFKPICDAFELYCCSKYDNEAGLLQYYKKNTRVFISLWAVFGISKTFQYAVFAGEDDVYFKDDAVDISGILAIFPMWAMVIKPFRIWFHRQLSSRSHPWSLKIFLLFVLALMSWIAWEDMGIENMTTALQYTLGFGANVISFISFWIVFNFFSINLYDGIYKNYVANKNLNRLERRKNLKIQGKKKQFE